MKEVLAALFWIVWSSILASVAGQFRAPRPVFSEIFPVPERSDRNEFIEIYNPTGLPFDLEGYKVCDGDMALCSNLYGKVPAFSYYVVCRDISQYVSCNIGTRLFLESIFALLLVDPLGTIIDTVIWPTENAPLGSSYVRGMIPTDLFTFLWDTTVSPGVGFLGGPDITAAPAAAPYPFGVVLINEVSTIDGFIEIAYDITQSIAQFQIIIYASDRSFETRPISDATPISSFNGLSFASLPFTPPTGSSFGIALVTTDGEVLQFISFGASLKPRTGPATGVASDYISQITSGRFAAMGSGCDASSFTIRAVQSSTQGQVNANQNPTCIVVAFINEILQGDESGNFVEIAYTRGFDPSLLNLEFYSKSGVSEQTLTLSQAIGGETVDGLVFDYILLDMDFDGFAVSRLDTDPPTLLHAVSVGDSFAGTSGSAAGQTLSSIGVPPINGVLPASFITSGCFVSDFFYVAQSSSPGLANIGQSISCGGLASKEFITARPSASPSGLPSTSPTRVPTASPSLLPTEGNGCEPNPCLPNAICTPDGSLFSCACPSGFTGNGLTTGCRDIDECTADPYPCDESAFCVDFDGSFSCGCGAGFTGNGFVCDDVNECQTLRPCSAVASCENTPGGYNCNCNAGYQGNGIICLDINECSTGANNCSPNAACTNTEGSFSCSCRNGFEGNGIFCTRVTPSPTPDPTPGPTRRTSEPTPKPTQSSSPPSLAPSHSTEPSISIKPSDSSPSATPSVSLMPSETSFPSRSPTGVASDSPTTSFPSAVPSTSVLPSVTKFPSAVPSLTSYPSLTGFPTQVPSRSTPPSVTIFPSRSPSN